MKVLVATSRTQGSRANDYRWAVDGELVWIQEPCDTDQKRKGDCGCGRGFAGLAPHRATTTAEVRDLPELTLEEYILALRTGLADAGWPEDWAEEIAAAQTDLIKSWPAGSVVERDLERFSVRASHSKRAT
jgi:hypothetical protein